jgi:hypothetical protein
MNTLVTEDSLRYAIKRVEDFYAVQRDAPFSHKIDAVNTLLGSMGLTAEIKLMLLEWIEKFADESNSGSVMLGILVCLFAHDYNADRAPS